MLPAKAKARSQEKGSSVTRDPSGQVANAQDTWKSPQSERPDLALAQPP